MEALPGPGNRARLTVKSPLAAAAFDMQPGDSSGACMLGMGEASMAPGPARLYCCARERERGVSVLPCSLSGRGRPPVSGMGADPHPSSFPGPYAAPRPAVVRVGMEGPHQLDNAAAAATVAAVLKTQAGLSGVSLEGVAAGLAVARLPGRFQRCRLRADPDGPWVVLDGAHTPEAAAALVRTLRRAFPEPAPVALVLATAADKDLAGICRELGALGPVVTLPTRVDVAGAAARATPPGTVMAAWQFNVRRPGRTIIQPSARAAVETARRELGPAAAGGKPSVILVTGSLHAAGAVLNTVPLA